METEKFWEGINKIHEEPMINSIIDIELITKKKMRNSIMEWRHRFLPIIFIPELFGPCRL